MYKELIGFYILAAVFIIYLLINASLFSILIKKKYSGFYVLFFWSIIIGSAYFFDYYVISSNLFYTIVLAIPFVITLGIRYQKVSYVNVINLVKTHRLVHQFILFFVANLILFIPLLLALPAGSIVPGHFINNDSVIHTIFFNGYEYSRGLGLTRAYNEWYPRGYHSLVFEMNKILKLDSYYLLIPSTIFSYSFIYFAMYDLLQKFTKEKVFVEILISAGIFVPFLQTISIYHLFVPQVASIPLVIGGVFYVTKIDLDKINFVDFIIIAAAIAGAWNVYSIFAVSIIGVSIILKLFYAMFIYRHTFRFSTLSLNASTFFDKFKKNKSKYLSFFVYLAIFFSVISAPSFLFTYNLFQINIIGASPLLESIGNLPGFLSPLHLSGLWGGNIPYWKYPESSGTKYGYLLLFAIIAQLFFIFKSRRKFNSELFLPTLAVIIPFVSALIIISNQYILFKYFTYLIPVFIFLFLITVFDEESELFHLKTSYLIVILFILIGTISPLKSYKQVPVVTQSELQDLKQIRTDYMENNSVLIVSIEDWFRYFTNQKDEYSPYTQYLEQSFDDNINVNIVINDKKYPFLLAEMPLHYPLTYKRVMNTHETCIKHFNDRFDIYDLECKK